MDKSDWSARACRRAQGPRLRVLAVVALVCAAGAAFAGVVPATRPLIIPEPQYLQWRSQAGFRLNAATRIVVNAKADKTDLFAANQLRQKVRDTTGFLPKIVRASSAGPTRNVIAIGDPARNAAVKAVLEQWRSSGKGEYKIRPYRSKPEGYVLAVRKDSIVVSGFDQRGTFYGCQTLIQLLEHFRKAPVSSLFCYDYPDLAWRGMLVGFSNDSDPEFAKQFISEIMARYKMNKIEIYVGDGTRWDCHPELYRTPNAMPKAKLKAFLACARQHFVEPIPAFSDWNWGECWLARNGTNQDLVENPGEELTVLCFRNPEARKIVDDVRDEIIKTFNAKYILNSGMSEAPLLVSPKCPRCKDKDPLRTFEEMMRYDARFFAARGVRPIMWGDTIRADMPTGEKLEAWKCVPNLPKSIIVQDWDYSTKKEFPSSGIWKANGMDFIGSPYGFGSHGYVGKENIYYWAQSAKKWGALGVVGFNKYNITSKEKTLGNGIRIIDLGCLPFLAEWSWSVGKPNWQPAPYDGIRVIRNRLAGLGGRS